MGKQLYVDGGWVDPAGAGSIEVVDPATEEVIDTVPDASATDVDRAVAAARAAADGWATLPVAERAALCVRLADRLDAVSGDLAALVTREVGTPLVFSQVVQVPMLPMLLRQYAEMACSYEWESQVGPSLVVREPIGVVGAITPWNYPLVLTGFKLAPALAAGCTVVLKPSELAPLSAFALAEEVHASGFPPGVFNLVTGGPPAGARLVGHPEVDMISFTGSTATGAKAMEGAAATIKRVHLELGGKSPAVVLPDADLEQAVTAVLQQCFMNAGQTCMAWSRLLVPADQQEAAVELLTRQIEALYPVGDPTGPVAIGPLVSASQRERVLAHIRAGVIEGARLVYGGPTSPPDLDRGYYVRPTVFADVTNDMAIAREEAFGPVLCVLPYEDEDEAINIANDSIYGLHGAVFSQDPDHALAVARRIRAGQVDINGFTVNPMAPFGGYRQSGNGRELGVEGFEAFLETKSIARS